MATHDVAVKGIVLDVTLPRAALMIGLTLLAACLAVPWYAQPDYREIVRLVLGFYAFLFIVIGLPGAVPWGRLYRVAETKLAVAELNGLPRRLFQDFLAELFRQRGYEVTNSTDSLTVTAKGKTRLVHWGRYSDWAAPLRAVQGLSDAEAVEDVASGGVFVTTNVFTRRTERFAEARDIELVDGATLAAWTRAAGLSVPAFRGRAAKQSA